MAFSFKLPLIFFLSSLLIHAALANAGAFKCEDLPEDVCAFSVASNGKRCVLETAMKGKRVQYQCKASEIVVEKMAEYIETDECVKACGVDRNTVGISSDALLESQFTAKLCSSHCQDKCDNIVDLYFNLAVGEGVYLPDLCKAQRGNFLSGDVAMTPASTPDSASAIM